MAQYAANEIENMPDSPVAREDLGAGGIPRGAGARSPLFWKVLLLSVAVIWGYSFTTMKDALGTIPVFELLYVRFLPAALVMFAVFHKRITAHFNARNLIVGLSMGVLMWAAYALQTVGLAYTTAGKNAFLTGTYCILVPFASYLLSGENSPAITWARHCCAWRALAWWRSIASSSTSVTSLRWQARSSSPSRWR